MDKVIVLSIEVDQEVLTEVLVQTTRLILLEYNSIDVSIIKKKISQYQTFARESVYGKPGKGWQALGAAMMILSGILLICTGILMAVGTYGVASAPGIATLATGSGLLITGASSFWYNRQKGLSKEMDIMGNTLRKNTDFFNAISG